MQVERAVLIAREEAGPRTLATSPAVLTPLANRPLLLHGLDALHAAGVRSVAVLVGGRREHDVRAAVAHGAPAGMEVRCVPCPPAAGVADGLREAAPLLAGEPFVAQRGDALVHDGVADAASRFSISDLDALALRVPAAGEDASAATGACFLAAGALDREPPSGLDLARLVAWLHDSGGRVSVEEVDGCLPCGGGRDALLAANRRALDGLVPGVAEGAVVERSDLQGPVVIHPTAEVHDSVIRGPAIVGPRAQIRHAYVGPYSSLGADVVVEGAELEHSLILDGAQVRFVGARMESCILGRDSRIGRDYGVPRAMRVVVADGANILLP